MIWTKLINWIKPSLQDDKGESSYKRLTILAFVIASLYAFVTSKIDTSFMLHAYYANLTLISVMMGWVTVPQIIKLLKIKENVDKDKDNTTSSDPANTDNYSNISQL